MRNVLLVVRHEVFTSLTKRSFWIATFLFPMLIAALSLAPQLLTKQALGDEAIGLLTGSAGSGQLLGYVDESGLITTIPAQYAMLRAYPDRAAAAEAMRSGAIGQFYVIPQDVLARGEIISVGESLSPIAGSQSEGLLRRVLTVNLLRDEQLSDLVLAPSATATMEAVAPAALDNRASAAGFGVSFALMFILFFSITTSSSYMLQSVAKEKENRTAEVLLTSLQPSQLMTGKVIGLGALALIQIAIWMGVGMALYNGGASLLDNLGGVTLPDGFAVYLLVYFILGYLVYSSALGALGALVPNTREGSQFTFIIILPLLVPLWFNTIFLEDPNGVAATLLSLFPLTAPTAMVTRLATTSVPAWQPLAGIVLLAITAAGFVLLAARFFRADTLLSDATLNWRRLLKELRGARGGE
jgi:ABC-2 type transport system permease protein